MFAFASKLGYRFGSDTWSSQLQVPILAFFLLQSENLKSFEIVPIFVKRLKHIEVLGRFSIGRFLCMFHTGSYSVLIMLLKIAFAKYLSQIIFRK